MGTAYNRNLYFYTAFVAFLTGYIFTLYGGDTIRVGNVFNETVCKNDPKTNGMQKILILWVSIKT